MCWDVDQHMDAKFGQVSSCWPPVLRHAAVVSFRDKRAAPPLEFLGLFGIDPYPPAGKRPSHLVNVV